MRKRKTCSNCGGRGHDRRTCTLEKTARGRAMRLAGAGFSAPQIARAVSGCSLEEAQRHVRERNQRVQAHRPLWSDTGDHLPPPEALKRDRPQRRYG